MGDAYDARTAAGAVQVTPPTRQRHRAPVALRRCILSVLLGSSMVMGCTAGSPALQAAQPPPAVNCFPQSVFTAAEMRARVDCHPREYKLELDANTAVLFAFPGPALDWVGPIFLIHIPSVSEVVLDREGQVMFESYKSAEGRTAIEHVRNNPDLMTRILEQAQ